jgi:DNA-binding transcriptional LysR family regulator
MCCGCGSRLTKRLVRRISNSRLMIVPMLEWPVSMVMCSSTVISWAKQRTTRSVSLTEAGEQYLSYCEQALASLQMGDDFIAGLSKIPTGQLRVSAPQSLIDIWMPTVVIPFLQRYPKINLQFVQSNRPVDLIKDNFDIAMQVSAEQIQDSSLIYRKIYHSEWALVASQQHIEQYGLATTPQALTYQPSVGTAGEINDGLNHDSFNWQGQKVVLKHRLAVNGMVGVKQAIMAGLGFGMVPKNMISNELATQKLIEISQDIEIKPTSLYVVYPSRSGQPAKLKAFVDALLEWSKGLKL